MVTRLWRLTRAGHTSLGGAGTLKHGGRYSLPGVPVVTASVPPLVVRRFSFAECLHSPPMLERYAEDEVEKS